MEAVSASPHRTVGPNSIFPMKRFFNNAILLLVSFAVALGAVEVAARIGFPEWREFLSEWFMDRTRVRGHGTVSIGQPGFDGHFAQNNGDFRAHIRINAFGLRNAEPPEAAAGRLWVIGDSFAFGWGVDGDKVLSSQLAEITGTATYNVASPGADVCGYQGLVARMPKAARPSGVIVVLTLENDLRNYDCAGEAAQGQDAASQIEPIRLSTVKQFLMRHSALYNLTAVTIKRVPALNETLIGLGLLQRGHAIHAHFAVAEIAGRTAATARELAKLRDMFDPALPFAVVSAPARFEIRDSDAFFRDVRIAQIKALEDVGIAVIDPFPAFKAAGFAATHFAHDGHWSAAGHAVVAAAAAEWVQRQFPAKRP
jgi:hypothetical protein